MSLPACSDTKMHCKTDRESWRCPDRKERANGLDMSGEHYECKVCEMRHFLD